MHHTQKAKRKVAYRKAEVSPSTSSQPPSIKPRGMGFSVGHKTPKQGVQK